MKRTGLMIFALGLFLFAQAAQAQWSPAKRLTWTSGDTLSPVIAVDSKNAIHVFWYDDIPGNREIYYRRSADGGKTWSAADRLTRTSSESDEPAIVIDSGDTIHLVWGDETPGNSEIYYKKSSDGGTTWSATQRLTWTSGGSGNSAIAIDPDNAIHVVWEDDTPGNDEIYYKKGK